MSSRPQRGMALLIALVLMAVMTSLVITLFSRLTQQTALAAREQQYQQASGYLTSAESLALSTLRRSLATASRVHLGQAWAAATPSFPVPQGAIAVTLSDGQACFNINALAGTSIEQRALAARQFVALLLRLGVAGERAEKVTQKVTQSLAGGSTLFIDISELRAVEGIDAALYNRLTAVLCALPQADQHINVNTLRVEQSAILEALFPDLRAGQARRLLQQRPATGWQNVGQFLVAGPLAQLDSARKTALAPLFSVDSRYFLLRAQVHYQQVTRESRTFISRDAANQFSVRWRQGGEIE